MSCSHTPTPAATITNRGNGTHGRINSKKEGSKTATTTDITTETATETMTKTKTETTTKTKTAATTATTTTATMETTAAAAAAAVLRVSQFLNVPDEAAKARTGCGVSLSQLGLFGFARLGAAENRAGFTGRTLAVDWNTFGRAGQQWAPSTQLPIESSVLGLGARLGLLGSEGRQGH